MTRKRLRVRTIDLPRHIYFEDRLWPALAGVWTVAGSALAAVAYWGADDWRRGAMWPVYLAASILITSALSSLVLALSSPRRMKRAFSLSLCLSILINSAVAIVLSWVHIPVPIAKTPEAPKEPDPVVQTETLAEFFEMQDEGDDRPQHDLRQPVETGEPDRDNRELLQKTAVMNRELPDQQPDVAAPTPSRPTPVTMQRREFAESAPRLADYQGTLSRQPLQMRPVVGTAASARNSQSTSSQSTAQSQTSPQPPSPTPANSELTPTSRPLAESLSQESLSQQPPTTDSELSPALTPTLSRAEALDERLANPEQLASIRRPRPQRRMNLHSVAPQLDSSVDADLPEVPRLAQNEPAIEPIAQPSRRESLSPAPTELDAEVVEELVRLDDPGVRRSEALAQSPREASIDLQLPERDAISTPQPSRQAIQIDRRLATAEEQAPIAEALPSAARPREMASVEHPLTLPSPSTDPTLARLLSRRAGTRSSPRRAETGMAESSTDQPAADVSQTTGSVADSVASPRNESAIGRRTRRRSATQLPAPQNRTRPVLRPENTEVVNNRQPSPRAVQIEFEESMARRGQVSVPEAVVIQGAGQVQPGVPSALADSGVQRSGGESIPAQKRTMSGPLPARRQVVAASPALPTNVELPQLTSPGIEASMPTATAASRGTGRNRETMVSAGPQAASDQSIAGASIAPLAGPSRLARASASDALEPQVAETQSAPVRSSLVGSARPRSADVNVPMVRQRSTAEAREAVAVPTVANATRSARPTRDAAEPNPASIVDASPGISYSPSSSLRRFEGDTSVRSGLSIESGLPNQYTRRAASIPQRPGTGNDGQVTIPQVTVDDAGGDRGKPAEPSAADLAENGRPSSATADTGGLASPAGLRVDVAARDGLGGLGTDMAVDIGQLTRRAAPESIQISDSVGRFRQRDPGGALAIMTRDTRAASAFQTRLNRQGEQPYGGNGKPSPRTEEAIELGLLYLADVQQENGSWSLRAAGDVPHLPEDQQMLAMLQSDTAATGLSLLSFLGAGYHHRSEKYGREVLDGLNHLIRNQGADGNLFERMDKQSNQSAWLYSHGIAAIALCEAYGMTQDPQLRGPAQRAVDFIVDSQHPQRGGWRYTPRYGSDTSVSGWMVMALRSAELANLEVPTTVWDGVDKWLNRAQASVASSHLFRYNPYAADNAVQGHGRKPSTTITAVGLLMRMYTGWRRSDDAMIRGAKHLQENLPAVGTWEAPRRDTYYWYYATQVMFHMGGDYWKAWNDQLHPLLISSQVQIGPLAGSWDPGRPIPDRWGPHAGRLYVTTMNLLSLEVYYRHLPIYEDTAR